MNIYFYNNYHNGDVFLSREFVRDIKRKIGEEHYYIHNNDFSILKDFDIKQIKIDTPGDNSSVTYKENDIFINTWIGQNNAKYLKYGCSMKSFYLLYSEIFEKLNINIEKINFYTPTVDFNLIDKFSIDKFVMPQKSLLVCNNVVLSGQSPNFDFDLIIDYLSNIFNDFLFIMTNDTKLSKLNVISADSIIGNKINNLLEISYLSTKCDIIMGRPSGPYIFTLIKDNIINSNKIFIGFSYCEGDTIVIQETKSKSYWFNNFNEEFIKTTIKSLIQ